MCGIVGALDPAGALGRTGVERMNEAQHHRGPDDAVVVEEGPFLLGNTRLAIQDPTAAGNQPFRHPAGRFVVVFNGEIYNFKELIEQHRLPVHTGCDGEIIPLLWERFGPACLEQFRGMFGLAVLDVEAQRLYLARDPFGIKPLHWRRLGPTVAFATEIAPLWRIDRQPALDPAAVVDYLAFGAVDVHRSPYADIHAVRPGQCISFDVDGVCRDELLVDPLDAPAARDHRSWTLADALHDTVRLHLIADVPTAHLLSAGLDSTFIALAARDLGQQLHCLTITGPMGDDEAPLAAATAREYGHHHEAVSADLDDSVADDFLRAMQRPSIDGLNSFLVCRAVRQAGFKVALSGLGGDEALGGYRQARLLPFLRALRVADRVPGSPLARLVSSGPVRARLGGSGKLLRLAADGGPRSAAGLVRLQRELFPAEVVESLVGARPVPPPTDGDLGYRAMSAEEVARYMQPMLLADADAYSMASSVELRVPFVDTHFFAAALERQRLRGKLQLVDDLGDRYLSELAKRPKTGFAVPMLTWLREGALRGVLDDARRPDAPVWDVLDPTAGRAVLDRIDATTRWSEAWAIAALDGWLRRR